MRILLQTKRRIVQAISLVALNSNFLSLETRGLCIPVMNCEACAVAWLGCPIGMMARSINYMEFPVLVLACVLGIGLLVGRLFCGWICPMGFLQDLLYKIRSIKFDIPHFFTWFKYGFLLLSVVVASYFINDYEESFLFFCKICPTSALQVVIPEMVKHQDYSMDTARIIRFSVLAGVIVLAIGNHRSFCKVMCPVGALVAIGNKFSIFSLKLNKEKCTKCTACDRNCPMDVKVMESPEATGRAINRDTECIECLTCESKCPTTAISNNSRILHE